MVIRAIIHKGSSKNLVFGSYKRLEQAFLTPAFSMKVDECGACVQCYSPQGLRETEREAEL